MKSAPRIAMDDLLDRKGSATKDELLEVGSKHVEPGRAIRLRRCRRDRQHRERSRPMVASLEIEIGSREIASWALKRGLERGTIIIGVDGLYRAAQD